jgi:hypothetical protein
MWVTMRRFTGLPLGIVTFMLGRRSITTGIKPDGMQQAVMGLDWYAAIFRLPKVSALRPPKQTYPPPHQIVANRGV